MKIHFDTGQTIVKMACDGSRPAPTGTILTYNVELVTCERCRKNWRYLDAIHNGNQEGLHEA